MALAGNIRNGSYLPDRIVQELQCKDSVGNGKRGASVRRVQELLTLAGFATPIDGGFGAATERALREFQQAKGLRPTGVCDARTFTLLAEPIVRAVGPVPKRRTLGETVVACAEQHLECRPREAGGDNLGIWVRCYLGWDGPEARWCAGFVCTILEQACACCACDVPIKFSGSCDVLAERAKASGAFVSAADLRAGRADPITPGCLFLVRNTPTDWTHVGIVADVDGDTFRTIEGNTNDGGSANGFEATARVRGFDNKKDFIRI
jgi:peptidoglycan hydrolase-like protein with peptidoglycan-binding domain